MGSFWTPSLHGCSYVSCFCFAVQLCVFCFAVRFCILSLCVAVRFLFFSPLVVLVASALDDVLFCFEAQCNAMQCSAMRCSGHSRCRPSLTLPLTTQVFHFRYRVSGVGHRAFVFLVIFLFLVIFYLFFSRRDAGR